MKLPIEAVKSFQAAWLASFEEEIDLEKAEVEAMRLLSSFSLLSDHHEYEQRGTGKIF